jgi:hypothetical protein
VSRFRGNTHPWKAAPEFDEQNETKIDRVVAAVCDGLAKAPEAGITREGDSLMESAETKP